MRRNFKKNVNYFDSKVITFSVIGVILLATVVFAILMYGKKVDDDVRSSQLSTEQIASITENGDTSESTSSSIGKSIEEAEEDEENVISKEANSINDITNTITTTNTYSQNTALNSEAASTETTGVKEISNDTKKDTETKKELSFAKPVEGEIISEFAKDNLIYSQTLAEWVTHSGIDIKADKTTVVQSAEEGTIKSIKNDPRYGLTIVITHQDGFETLYANLLSSEFVKEGDKVTKGQSIGTVGNTGVFESADEPHLHFEILKDSEAVDPSIYLK